MFIKSVPWPWTNCPGPAAKVEGSGSPSPGADPNLCMLHLIKHLCSIADAMRLRCVGCVYGIIPYDLP